MDYKQGQQHGLDREEMPQPLKIKSHRDLTAWQQGRRLVKLVYELTEDSLKHEEGMTL